MTSNNPPVYDQTQKSLWYDFLFNLSYNQNNRSFFNLIKFFGENTEDNINVNFTRKNSNKTTMLTSFAEIYNILSTSSNATNEQERDLWNYLINKGLDFNKSSIEISERQEVNAEYQFLNIIQTQEVGPKDIHPLFDNTREKNMFLLQRHTDIYGIEETKKQLLKYSTMHQCVRENRIEFISFILKNYNLDINSVNEFGETPLMLVNKPDMLEIILAQKPNALLKDSYNSDAIKRFTSNIRAGHNEFMDMAITLEKYIIANPQFNQESQEDQIKRKEATLLNFVETDKTKKDIEDYIKKVKLKKTSHIVNSDGLNLAYITLSKQSWSKFFLFYDQENSQFKSPKTGTSYLELMLFQHIRSKLEPATNILHVLIKDYKGDVAELIENFTQQQINKSIPFSIPQWINAEKSFSRFLTAKTDTNINFKSLSNNNIYSVDDYEKQKEAVLHNFKTLTDIILILKPEQKLTFEFNEFINWGTNKEDEFRLDVCGFMNYQLVKEYTFINRDKFSEKHMQNIEKTDEKIIETIIKQLQIHEKEKDFQNYMLRNRNEDLYKMMGYYLEDENLINNITDSHLEDIKKGDNYLANRIQYHRLQNKIATNENKSNKFKI